MECQFCKKTLSSKSALNFHQTKTRYCLKIQGKNIKGQFVCDVCGKDFQTKSHLNSHLRICDIPNMRKLIEQVRYLNEIVKVIQKENDILKQDKKELQDRIQNIATTSILNDKDKIMKLTKKYVRKRPRQQFEERNVVYIITTPSLKKERRYILGKATNLTNRLSTYNKTDEHEVVFYKSCNSKEMMSCIENMIFNKLSSYREQANRERFILPEDQEISFFSTKIEECINFFC